MSIKDRQCSENFNLTPSAISQSIQKLRTIFPDPLFIRKAGVTPTTYATHLHEYISRGWNLFLAP